jgi:hypothetical protein
MVTKLGWALRWQIGCYAGYSVLLLFGLSGLMLQGGIWLLVGFLFWFVTINCLLMIHIQSIYSKYLKDVPHRVSVHSREKGTG